MSDNRPGSVRRRRAPLGRGFVLLVIILAALQFAFFALLSPPLPAPQPGGKSWGGSLAGEKAGIAWAEWLWLQSPAILLSPFSRGFSGAAWLNRTASEPQLEESSVEAKPMPFVPPPQASSWVGLLPRPGSGLGSSWAIPDLPPAVTVEAIPIPQSPSVRIVEGLGGWRLVAPSVEGLPIPPAPAKPTMVRVAVDAGGEVLSPPVIWDSSGFAEADQSARSLVTRLRLEWIGDGAPPQASWGLVGVDWGSAPANGS